MVLQNSSRLLFNLEGKTYYVKQRIQFVNHELDSLLCIYPLFHFFAVAVSFYANHIENAPRNCNRTSYYCYAQYQLNNSPAGMSCVEVMNSPCS